MLQFKNTVFILLSVILLACNSNKNVSEASELKNESIALNGNWEIIEVDKLTNIISDSITIVFNENKISGKAHCNSYFSSFEETDGGIRIKPIGATRMSCPELDKEQQYFKTLQSVVKKEITFKQPYYILNLYNNDDKLVIKGQKKSSL